MSSSEILKPTAEQLKYEPFFTKVANKSDWKAPIDALCPEQEMQLVKEAILFYTATEPVFSGVPGKPELRRVIAPGYRLGPAGDH